MKFQDVKVGDNLYVKRSISYGWRQQKSFCIPTKVVRVTKTQFIVELNDGRYKKDTGSGYGDTCGYAYKEG